MQQGEVFFNDVGAAKTYKLDASGKPVEFLADSKKGDGQAFGPDGDSTPMPGTRSWPGMPRGNRRSSQKAFAGMISSSAATVPFTSPEPGWDGTKPSNIWLIKPGGEKRIVDTGLKFSNGITLSTDQSLLYVDDSRSHWVYSYQIQADGSLKSKQRYYHMHEPDTADDSGADGMEVDSAGRLYVATRLGIQVCDQAGRVNCILPTPNGKVSNVIFGGADFSTLYATCGDKVFKRKLQAKGAPSFLPALKPEKPRL
jgi:hypothetical protein